MMRPRSRTSPSRTKRRTRDAAAAAAAASGSNCRACKSYLSSQSTLDRTTLMKSDLKRASQSSLRAAGSDLLVRVGRTEDVLEQLMRDTHAASLYTHVRRRSHMR